MTVPAHRRTAKPGGIVVGYDASEAARRCLARAREISAAASPVLVVAVVPEIETTGLASEPASAPFDATQALAEARDLLGGGDGSTIETRMETGDPAGVLVDIARALDARLIIVGRRGGDFVRRALLGSVAERVVQQAPCDVLVVA